MRLVRRDLKQPDAVTHLFEEIAPRYLGRPGGYTRIYRSGFRKGDNAPMVLLEFIEAEMPEKEGGAGKGEPEKKKGRLASLLSRAKPKDKTEAPKKKAKKEEE
jgi:large subunit ribosomal protein L17